MPSGGYISHLECKRVAGAKVDHVPAAGAGSVGVDDVADIEALSLLHDPVGAVDAKPE
jgi:hypothetical protein